MRIFPVNVQIESMEDDGNSVDEMDNEFGEELNDEWVSYIILLGTHKSH
jgi:hypothetical protein